VNIATTSTYAIRAYEPEDYPTISSWWEARGVVGPPANRLKVGFICEHRSIPAACAFLYLDATGSGMAWLAWQASNPKLKPLTAGRAMFYVEHFAELEAKANDYWLIMATTELPSLERHLRHRGYIGDERPHTRLYKTLT